MAGTYGAPAPHHLWDHIGHPSHIVFRQPNPSPSHASPRRLQALHRGMERTLQCGKCHHQPRSTCPLRCVIQPVCAGSTYQPGRGPQHQHTAAGTRGRVAIYGRHLLCLFRIPYQTCGGSMPCGTCVLCILPPLWVLCSVQH